MATDESLIKLTTEAIEKIDLVFGELIRVQQSDKFEKYNIGTIGRSIGLIREFQKSIFDRSPNLRPPPPVDYVPDPPLPKEQIALVNELNETDITKIDEILLSHACQYWRKVAFIVGKTMMELKKSFPGLSDIFYSQRIRHLVEEGKLESQGNLAIMRYSEVRLPSKIVCSFCNLPSNKVKKIIAGPKVSICNSCVELCVEILNSDIKDYSNIEKEAEISISSSDNITVGDLRSLIAKYHFETALRIKIV